MDADPLGRLDLLGSANGRDLIARKLEVVSTIVAVGADAVDDLDAGISEGRDRARRSEVDVVGVGG